jgi:transposase
MSESIGIDSALGGRTMPNPYSAEMRERVIARVESGASRRETAEHFEISASAAVKWLQRWRDAGSSTAMPRGGSTSPLEKHANWLLALIAKQPDLTLDEVFAAMRKRRIAGSRTALWRFFARHKITFKKKPAGGGARTSGRRSGAPALDSRARHAQFDPISVHRRDRGQY